MKNFFVLFFCVFLPSLLIYSASVRSIPTVLYRAHLCMKCSFGISDFLEEIANLSHSAVFLYFLHWYHTNICSFPFSSFCDIRFFLKLLKKALPSFQNWRAFFLCKLKCIWVLLLLYMMTFYIGFSFFFLGFHFKSPQNMFSFPLWGILCLPEPFRMCCLIFHTFSSVQSLSHVPFFVTPWIAAH